MKASHHKKPQIAAFSIIIILVAITGVFIYVTKYLAKNHEVDEMAKRLTQRGVPLKQLTVLNQNPLEIEIALQSSSENNSLSTEDRWDMLLANREATMAYRFGTRVKSYKLVVYNTKGEQISSGETYLYPDDLSQQMPKSKETKIDNSKTKEIIMSQLKLGTLKLDSFDVTSENIDGFNGQILNIQVSIKDREQAKQLLPQFIDSFFYLEETLNNKYGTYLVLTHLRVIDNQGKLLYDYARDIESGHTIASYPPDHIDELLSYLNENNKIKITPTPPTPYPLPIMKTASPELLIATPYP